MSTLEMPSDEQNTFAFHQYPCCSFLLKLYNCTSFFWTTFLFPFSSVFLLLATVPLTILYHYSKALALKDGWMDGWMGGQILSVHAEATVRLLLSLQCCFTAGKECNVL